MMLVIVHHSPSTAIVGAKGLELFFIKAVGAGLIKQTSKRGMRGINCFVIDSNCFVNRCITSLDCLEDGLFAKPCILLNNAIGADFQPCLLNY